MSSLADGGRLQPLGFGNCRRCPFLQSGSVELCYGCASKELESLPKPKCNVCDQGLPASGVCANRWCNRDDRHFDYIYAISMHSGRLKSAIADYKYNGQKMWAAIFGRVLVGYLNAHEEWFTGFDLIIPSPTFVGGRRTWDHIDEIVRRAAIEDGGRWPFERTGVIVKTADTETLVKKSLSERRRLCEEQLRTVLRVPKPPRVAGRDVLVIDDVFTDGSTLREVARALKIAGAGHVAQVTLARAPWQA